MNITTMLEYQNKKNITYTKEIKVVKNNLPKVNNMK